MNTTIKFDPNNLDSMRDIMDTYGGIEHMIFGKNESGEDVVMHINSDYIIVETHQNNEWTRINTYHYDGTCEETYEK